jgi:hypothetical protein
LLNAFFCIEMLCFTFIPAINFWLGPWFLVSLIGSQHHHHHSWRMQRIHHTDWMAVICQTLLMQLPVDWLYSMIFHLVKFPLIYTVLARQRSSLSINSHATSEKGAEWADDINFNLLFPCLYLHLMGFHSSSLSSLVRHWIWLSQGFVCSFWDSFWIRKPTSTTDICVACWLPTDLQTLGPKHSVQPRTKGIRHRW